MSALPSRIETPEDLPQLLVVHASEVKEGDALLLDGLHWEVFLDAELIPPPPGRLNTPASAIITYEGTFDGEPCAAWISYPENERVLVRRVLPEDKA